MSNWLPTNRGGYPNQRPGYSPSPTPSSYSTPQPGSAPGRGEYLIGALSRQELWFRNHALANPSDFYGELAGRGARFADVLVNDRFVFRVVPNDQDETQTTIPGQRGVVKPISKPLFLSQSQRTTMNASMFQPVKIRPYQSRGEEIAKMQITVQFLTTPQNPGWEGDLLNGDHLADTMVQAFGGQTLYPGLILNHEYTHITSDRRQEIAMMLRITIKAMETYIPNSEKPQIGTDEPSMSPTTRGTLTKESIIEVQKGENFNMRVAPSSKTVKAIIRHDISFEEMGIGGLDEQFGQIFRRAFASRQFPPGLVAKIGIQHVKGILLYGPPGTGKTLIARQIGKALNAREPKIVNGPEVLNKYVGASEENIRKLFADAEEEYKRMGEDSELHIIIFDELDAICKQRGGKADGTGVGDSVVNQLLSKMDGVDQLNNILIIGMTNRMDMIDEALLRPGRLEVHIEIALADEAGRLQILKIHTRKIRESGALGDDVNLEELATRTKNFSGAEIEGLVKSAMSFSFNRHVGIGKKFDPKELERLKVTRQDFLQALDEVKPAFGVAEDEFAACATSGIIQFSPFIKEILDEGALYTKQVRNSKATPLVSVILHGPEGSGKTALAATIALNSEFPFIKLISPESMVGYNDMSKISHLTKVFMDAYKSPLNIVVVDNIERIIGYNPVGPSFSNPVLQTLATLLRKPPPKGRRLLIIATTADWRLLDRLGLRGSFDADIGVPNVSDLHQLQVLMKEANAFSPQVIDKAIRTLHHELGDESLNVGVKKVLMAVETARQDENPVDRFVRIVEKAASEMKVTPPVRTGATFGEVQGLNVKRKPVAGTQQGGAIERDEYPLSGAEGLDEIYNTY